MNVWQLGLALAVLLAVSQAQVCDEPLGLASGAIEDAQLISSSVGSGLTVQQGRYNCCSTNDYGAWCPANAAAGEWFEVRFPEPVNLTGLLLQQPWKRNGTVSDVITIFRLQVELASAPPGELSLYTRADNSTEMSVNLTASEEDRVMLDMATLVRRVRLEVVNFTGRPCFRLELLGCQAQGMQVPEGLVKPSLTLDYSSLDNMALVCSHSNGQPYGVRYQVTWYRDSNMVGSSFLDSGVTSASLNVTAQDFSRLQIHKCSLQACYAPRCGNASEFSPSLDSNTYRPEIKIENTEELYLTEGGMPGVIQISANAPPALFCALDQKSPDCVVVAVTSVVDENAITCPKAAGRSIPHLLFPEQIAGSQASLCSVRLTTENWQGVSNISVTANRDMKVDGNRSTTVTITTVIGNDFTYTDTAKSIKVTVIDADKLATCSMLKDHVLTFDRTEFDNPIEGEFILYQHKELPYEVRAYSRFCGDVATCLCAVAVRAGDDVVRVSGCRQGEGLNAKLFANGGLESDLKMYQFQGGAKYEVVLPTGGRVVIRQSYMTYLSVWLYPSPLDVNNTMGLCGDFDGDMANDLTTSDGNVISISNLYPNQFTVSWRVNRTESLYNGLCPERAKTKVTSVARGTLCACSSIDSPTCQSGRGVLACHMLNQYFPDNEITSSLFERRATPSNCFDAVAPLDQFSYNETVLEPNPDKWPAPWDRNSTRAECVKVLNASRAARLCAEVPGLQVLEERRLQYCVRDIQMTNDTAWAGQLALYLEEACLARLDNDLGLAISQEVKDAVTGGLCPMDCSGHGVCENGACVCDDGFVGFGCEVQSSIAPVITRVGGQGLCSALLDNCTTVTLYGQTFVKSDSLQCRYRVLQVNSTGYYYTGPVMTSASTVFVSKSEVRCSLPQTGNYAVAISNNRNNFSEDAIFLSYNPICFRCDAMMGTCEMKNDSCVIGKQCFPSMARHPDNHTLVCDPSRSNSAWSNLTNPCLSSNVTHMDKMGNAIAFHNHRTVYNVSSLENCRDLCVQEPNFQCRSVDFRRSARTCRLSKYRSADVGNYFATFSPDFTYSQWGCENDRCPSSYVRWTTTSGYVTPGKNDVILRDVLTLELCQERCLGNSSCMAVKYNAVRAICILSAANRTDNSSGWIQVPMWSYSEFACKAGSPSERMGPSVSMATLVPTFRLDGQDTYECQFSPLTTATRSVLYGVLWRVDGAWLEEDPPTNNMTDTFLPAAVAAMVKEGTELACAVSACYEDMCEDTRGPLVISNTFTASLKIEGGSGTTLREGDAGETIMIYATAPPHVLCRNQSLSNDSACTITISASVAVDPNEVLCPNGDVIPQVSVATFANDTETRVCQMTFTETSWTTRYRVNVKATTDNKFDGDHERTFSLTAQYVVNGVVEKNDTRRQTQLTVVDVDNGAICMSVNDPHMKTFDGRTYDNYYEGEFILYRHKTMPYSVRTFYRSCNGRASCNCAVAAQAGDDVIIIDKCGPKADNPLGFYPITVSMFRNGLLTPGFKIQSSYEGREYKVSFPSGTTLYAKRSVIRGYNYINVWLVPSASDFNMTEGLCGSFDGNVTNDLLSPDGTLDTSTSRQPNTFSKSWRVTGTDTLYTGKCSDASTSVTAAMAERPSFCYCQENGLERCSPGNDVFTCSFEDRATDITLRLIQNSLFPTKCAADASLLDAYPDFQADTTKEPGVSLRMCSHQ